LKFAIQLTLQLFYAQKTAQKNFAHTSTQAQTHTHTRAATSMSTSLIFFLNELVWQFSLEKLPLSGKSAFSLLIHPFFSLRVWLLY